MLVPSEYSTVQHRDVTTYYVGMKERGVLHCSIQQAIDKAETYSKIIIAGGQYFETLTITQPLELVGEKGDVPEIISRNICLSVVADCECHFENINFLSKTSKRKFASGSTSAGGMGGSGVGVGRGVHMIPPFPSVRILRGRPSFFRCNMTSMHASGGSYPRVTSCNITGNIMGPGVALTGEAGGEFTGNSISNHFPFCIVVMTKGTPIFKENSILQEPKVLQNMKSQVPYDINSGGAIRISMEGVHLDADNEALEEAAGNVDEGGHGTGLLLDQDWSRCVTVAPKFINNYIGDEVEPQAEDFENSGGMAEQNKREIRLREDQRSTCAQSFSSRLVPASLYNEGGVVGGSEVGNAEEEDFSRELTSLVGYLPQMQERYSHAALGWTVDGSSLDDRDTLYWNETKRKRDAVEDGCTGDLGCNILNANADSGDGTKMPRGGDAFSDKNAINSQRNKIDPKTLNDFVKPLVSIRSRTAQQLRNYRTLRDTEKDCKKLPVEEVSTFSFDQKCLRREENYPFIKKNYCFFSDRTKKEEIGGKEKSVSSSRHVPVTITTTSSLLERGRLSSNLSAGKRLPVVRLRSSQRRQIKSCVPATEEEMREKLYSEMYQKLLNFNRSHPDRVTVYVDQGCSPTFEENHIVGGQTSLLIASEASGVYQGNFISNSSIYGIHLLPGSSPYFRSNSVVKCATGVICYGSNASLELNTIKHCRGIGMLMAVSPQNHNFWQGNAFLDNDVGLLVQSWVHGASSMIKEKALEEAKEVIGRLRAQVGTKMEGETKTNGDQLDSERGTMPQIAASRMNVSRRDSAGGDYHCGARGQSSSVSGTMLEAKVGVLPLDDINAQGCKSSKIDELSSSIAFPLTTLHRGLFARNHSCGLVVVGGYMSLVLDQIDMRNNGLFSILLTQGATSKVIKCNFDGGNCGLFVEDYSSPVVEECMFENHIQSGIIVSNEGYGIVKKCKFKGFSGAGVTIQNKSHPTISDCHFTSIQGVGVHVRRSGKGNVIGNRMNGVKRGVTVSTGGDPYISENTLLRATEMAVFVTAGACGTFQKNVLEDCNVGIFSRDGATSHFLGNNIVGRSGFYGLRCSAGSCIKFEGNTVIDHVVGNILVEGKKNMSILMRNKAQGAAGGFGIRSTEEAEATIFENETEGNKIGLCCEDEGKCVFERNVSHRDATGIIIGKGGSSTFLSNTVLKSYSTGLVLLAGSLGIVKGAVIAECDHEGIQAELGSGGEVSDTLITRNDVGLYFSPYKRANINGKIANENRNNSTLGNSVTGAPPISIKRVISRMALHERDTCGVLTELSHPGVLPSLLHYPELNSTTETTYIHHLSLVANKGPGVVIARGCYGKLSDSLIIGHSRGWKRVLPQAVYLNVPKKISQSVVVGGADGGGEMNIDDKKTNAYCLDDVEGEDDFNGGGGVGTKVMNKKMTQQKVLADENENLLFSFFTEEEKDLWSMSSSEFSDEEEGEFEKADPMMASRLSLSLFTHGASSKNLPPPSCYSFNKEEKLIMGRTQIILNVIRKLYQRKRFSSIEEGFLKEHCGVLCLASNENSVIENCTLRYNDVGVMFCGDAANAATEENGAIVRRCQLQQQLLVDVLFIQSGCGRVVDCIIGNPPDSSQESLKETKEMGKGKGMETKEVVLPADVNTQQEKRRLGLLERELSAPLINEGITEEKVFLIGIPHVSLSASEKALLKDMVPNIDFNEKQILSVSKHPEVTVGVPSSYSPISSVRLVPRGGNNLWLAPLLDLVLPHVDFLESALIGAPITLLRNLYNSNPFASPPCQTEKEQKVKFKAPKIFLEQTSHELLTSSSSSMSSSLAPTPIGVIFMGAGTASLLSQCFISSCSLIGVVATGWVGVVPGGERGPAPIVSTVQDLSTDTVAKGSFLTNEKNLIFSPSFAGIENTVATESFSINNNAKQFTTVPETSIVERCRVENNVIGLLFEPNAFVSAIDSCIRGNVYANVSISPFVTLVQLQQCIIADSGKNGVVLRGSCHGRVALEGCEISNNRAAGVVFTTRAQEDAERSLMFETKGAQWGGSLSGNVSRRVSKKVSVISWDVGTTDTALAAATGDSAANAIPKRRKQTSITGYLPERRFSSNVRRAIDDSNEFFLSSSSTSNVHLRANRIALNLYGVVFEDATVGGFLSRNHFVANSACCVKFLQTQPSPTSLNAAAAILSSYGDREDRDECMLFENTFLWNRGEACVSVQEGTHPILQSNLFVMNYADAVRLEMGASGIYQKNRFTSNNLLGVIICERCTGQFTQNVFDHSSFTAMSICGLSNMLSISKNVYISNRTGISTVAGSGASCLVTECLFKAHAISAIDLTKESDMFISKNTFEAERSCVRLHSYAGGSVRWNTFHKSVEAITFVGLLGVVTICTSNSLRDNSCGFVFRKSSLVTGLEDRDMGEGNAKLAIVDAATAGGRVGVSKGGKKHYILHGNHFGPHRHAAVCVESGTVVEITRNSFEGGEIGVLITGGSRPHAHHNTFFKCQVGVEIRNAGCVLERNAFTECIYGTKIAGYVRVVDSLKQALLSRHQNRRYYYQQQQQQQQQQLGNMKRRSTKATMSWGGATCFVAIVAYNYYLRNNVAGLEIRGLDGGEGAMDIDYGDEALAEVAVDRSIGNASDLMSNDADEKSEEGTDVDLEGTGCGVMKGEKDSTQEDNVTAGTSGGVGGALISRGESGIGAMVTPRRLGSLLIARNIFDSHANTLQSCGVSVSDNSSLASPSSGEHYSDFSHIYAAEFPIFTENDFHFNAVAVSLMQNSSLEMSASFFHHNYVGIYCRAVFDVVIIKNTAFLGHFATNILIENGAAPTITGCYFTEGTVAASSEGGGGPFSMDSANLNIGHLPISEKGSICIQDNAGPARVISNSFKSCGVALSLGDCASDVQFQYNQIYSSSIGVLVRPQAPCLGPGMFIDSNYFDGCDIGVAFAPRCHLEGRIAGNLIQNCQLGILAESGGVCKNIANNTILKSSRTGIFVRGMKGIMESKYMFWGNCIQKCLGVGVLVNAEAVAVTTDMFPKAHNLLYGKEVAADGERRHSLYFRSSKKCSEEGIDTAVRSMLFRSSVKKRQSVYASPEFSLRGDFTAVADSLFIFHSNIINGNRMNFSIANGICSLHNNYMFAAEQCGVNIGTILKNGACSGNDNVYLAMCGNHVFDNNRLGVRLNLIDAETRLMATENEFYSEGDGAFFLSPGASNKAVGGTNAIFNNCPYKAVVPYPLAAPLKLADVGRFKFDMIATTSKGSGNASSSPTMASLSIGATSPVGMVTATPAVAAAIVGSLGDAIVAEAAGAAAGVLSPNAALGTVGGADSDSSLLNKKIKPGRDITLDIAATMFLAFNEMLNAGDIYLMPPDPSPGPVRVSSAERNKSVLSTTRPSIVITLIEGGNAEQEDEDLRRSSCGFSPVPLDNTSSAVGTQPCLTIVSTLSPDMAKVKSLIELRCSGEGSGFLTRLTPGTRITLNARCPLLATGIFAQAIITAKGKSLAIIPFSLGNKTFLRSAGGSGGPRGGSKVGSKATKGPQNTLVAATSGVKEASLPTKRRMEGGAAVATAVDASSSTNKKMAAVEESGGVAVTPKKPKEGLKNGNARRRSRQESKGKTMRKRSAVSEVGK